MGRPVLGLQDGAGAGKLVPSPDAPCPSQREICSVGPSPQDPPVPPQTDTPRWARESGGLEAVPLQGRPLRRSR